MNRDEARQHTAPELTQAFFPASSPAQGPISLITYVKLIEKKSKECKK